MAPRTTDINKPILYCPCCGKQCEVEHQDFRPALDKHFYIATCRNPSCKLVNRTASEKNLDCPDELHHWGVTARYNIHIGLGTKS